MTISGRATSNPMAPYFVQLREFERRLIREAFEVAGGDLMLTANVLGVHKNYVKARAKMLGGVFNNEPKHEPPDLAAKAWNTLTPPGRKRGRPRRATPAEAAPTDPPVVAAPAVEPDA